jgi:TctA family transporter
MFVNQNSLIIMLVLVLGGTLWWANSAGWTMVQLAVIAVVIFGFVAMGVYAQRNATADVPAILKAGKPILVEYYSEF